MALKVAVLVVDVKYPSLRNGFFKGEKIFALRVN